MLALSPQNPGGEPVTMTSLEMVEFINAHRQEQAAVAGEAFPSKRFALLAHSDFMRKVPEVLGQGVSDLFLTPYVHPQNGQTYNCYRFPKREACLMAMSYSYDLQAKVFDRMTELEGRAAKPAPLAINVRDQAQLVTIAMQLIEVNQEQQAKIDQQQRKIESDAPMVLGFERIAKSDGSMCVTDAAKTLQVQPRRLFQLLQERGWLYRRPMGSGWLAYQDRIQQGYLEHKVTTGERSSDGHEWSNTQVRVTPKGLARLAVILGRESGGMVAAGG